MTSRQPRNLPLPDDAELIRRSARGDKAALSALYDRYAGLLQALAIRMMGSRSEAEDLMHDVFVEAWQRAGDYDPARGTVKAWLCLRIRSRALDRKKSPRVTRAVSWEEARASETRASEIPAPDFDVSLRMEREGVRAALSNLSVEQLEVIELCYFSGCSMAEAAQQLQCPVGTVKSRLSSGRDRLRLALAPVQERFP